MGKIKLAPSILSCDFSKLAEEIKKVEQYSDYIEVDVMDGHFVPNISIGIPIVQAVRKSTKLVVDTQLMISEPWKYIEQFAKAGSDIIIVHQESMKDEKQFRQVLKQIRDSGVKAGAAINPPTPLKKLIPVLGEIDLALIMSVNPGFGGQGFLPEALPKISELRKLMEKEGYNFDLEVDGGIKLDNVEPVLKAGADVIVSGSGIFKTPNPTETAKKFKEVFKRYE
ncbi:TPA: ribulose-phosphate 3-epimerase [archaeon]|nr:ribulose-phosphate 3-epimerase [Candidatus Naiadarchaeales archaeon SRR2090159.bin1288]